MLAIEVLREGTLSIQPVFQANHKDSSCCIGCSRNNRAVFQAELSVFVFITAH